tara:strand:- start:126 stop:281 length:156 start_codon:yes stop_codon:yes gene_type:complete
MFSSPSYAEWTRLGESTEGVTFYVDFGSIRSSSELKKERHTDKLRQPLMLS